MNDVTRRLDYGNAGKKVRAEEDGIIASLDKMISDLQDQLDQQNQQRQRQRQQQQQRQRQNGQDQDRQKGRQRRIADGDPARGTIDSNPAEESMAARANGAGQVQSKNIGKPRRLGRSAAEGSRGSHAANRQGISLPLPRHNRAILPQIGVRGRREIE